MLERKQNKCWVAWGMRISELRDWHIVTVICPQCQRTTEIDHRMLRARRRKAVTGRIGDLPFRCSSCGAKHSAIPLARMAPRLATSIQV